ncbi:hypothetical protein F4677DRAFT_419296 [Hypoxylon crocopeplum]|nr:hypothetical protein F4677DRAFT_419296 [Hypoxylon crocopeplum]
MGLSGPRNRRKLQHDPNNTKWSRDETTFGQKILRAQGWEPGKFLGAQDASHSHLHSAASAAPINVLMKDDTLGLGAKPRHKQNAECTGLDVFKDLLGRLNGKSEEVIEKERQVRSGIKTNLYVEKKYGLMRFVSGGLLVGDQIKELVATTTKAEPSVKVENDEPATAPEDTTTRPAKKQKEKKSKKRKAEEFNFTNNPDIIREKKRKRRSKDESFQEDSSSQEPEKSSRKKKSKKSKREGNDETEPTRSDKKKKSKKSKKDSEHKVEDDVTPIALEDALLEKSASKKERKERKKKDKKDKKHKRSDISEASTDVPTPASIVTPQESSVATPTGTGTSTPQAFSARHYARSRNIASKRMAMADLQALNQIFMVKPV